MRMINKLAGIAAIAMIALIGGSMAYGAFTVSSNVVHVKLEYQVNLDVSVSGGTATLTATASNDSTHYLNNVLIHFYYSITSGSSGWSEIALSPRWTDTSGVAITTFDLTNNQEYWFLAEYVP